MNRSSIIEFYLNDSLEVSVESEMAPLVGQYVNIRKVTYKVEFVSFAVDNADKFHEKRMRCNVNLSEW